MQVRALPGRRTRLRPWVVWVAIYVGLNASIAVKSTPFTSHDADWEIWQALPTALATGSLYNLPTEIPYVFSPAFAPVMAFAAIIGMWAWGAVQLGAVLLLRSPLLILLVVSSWGFWANVAGGSPMIFAVVSGALALRGSKAWALVYLGLLFLMPRPLQLPLALWLLWTMPAIRWPAVGLFVAHSALVVASGYATDWLSIMTTLGLPAWNIGPTHWLGLWWLVVGIPIGAYLLWRGRVGWAGLAWSTYLVPHNLLMPLVERKPALPAMVALTLIAYASEIANVWVRFGG